MGVEMEAKECVACGSKMKRDARTKAGIEFCVLVKELMHVEMLRQA